MPEAERTAGLRGIAALAGRPTPSRGAAAGQRRARWSRKRSRTSRRAQVSRVSDKVISLRGVEVHNLKQIDLDLPHGKLIVFCGV